MNLAKISTFIRLFFAFIEFAGAVPENRIGSFISSCFFAATVGSDPAFDRNYTPAPRF
jgi:hypothetical protein